MVVRISDKTQNYSKVTKLLVKPLSFIFYNISQIQFLQLAQASSDIVGVYS